MEGDEIKEEQEELEKDLEWHSYVPTTHDGNMMAKNLKGSCFRKTPKLIIKK